MKFISTCVCILFFTIAYTQVSVDGKIMHYDGESAVRYTPTVDGIIPAAARTGKKIQPERDGTFQIRITNPGFGTMKLHYKGLGFAFFYDEKSRIKLVIDQERIRFPRKEWTCVDSVKQAATVSIDGDFAAINRYYNRSPRSSTMNLSVSGSYYSRLIEKLQTPEAMITFIDSLKQIEFNEIKALGNIVPSEKRDASPVTPEIKRFLENQVHVFYGSIFLSAMMRKRVEQASKVMQSPDTPRTIYNGKWERLVEKFFVEASRKLFPAANSFEYNEFVFLLAYTQDNYKKYVLEQIPSMTNDELVLEGLLNPNLWLLDSLSLVDEDTRFAYKLQFLSRFLQTQTYYSPVLLNAVRELKRRYPDSRHLPMYDGDIEKLEQYLKSSAEEFKDARIIEKNYVLFSDVVERFKGQNIFIDVWATWCGPCVEDFNYKGVLKPFIREGQLVVLYVSMDKQIWRKKWKENMRFNQLEGYHILADEVLIEDMWRYLGGRQGVIPRYALIDKNGSIYLHDAARPSDGKRLIAQIEEMISKQ